MFLGFYFYYILIGNESINPSFNTLIFIPLMVLQMAFLGLGMGMIISALTTKYRDLSYLVSFGTQLLMYATPVVWPVSLLSEKISANMFKIYSFFPMVGVIEGFRAAILGKTPIPWDLILSGSITCLILIVLSLIYFSRKEKIFADVA